MNRTSSVPVSLQTIETVLGYLHISCLLAPFLPLIRIPSFSEHVHSCPYNHTSNALRTKPSKTSVSAELNILLIQRFFILHLDMRHFLLIQLKQMADMFEYGSIRDDAVHRLYRSVQMSYRFTVHE
jgi:hypothetical protein